MAESGVKDTLIYLVYAVLTFFMLQALIVPLHEFTHSTTAWLLGFMDDPGGIVWGNPLTLTGWDEGVSYQAIFESGNGIEAAAIAFSPLFFVHTVIIVVCLWLMIGRRLLDKKWMFHLAFWLVTVNFMELFAYMPMRAFALNGDIGNINHGLGLNPWILFVLGTALIIAGFFFIFGKALPRAYVVIGEGNRKIEYILLALSGFFICIWGSGLRVVLYIYPDPQWAFGLTGFAAFGVICWICRPTTGWVVQAMKKINDEIDKMSV